MKIIMMMKMQVMKVAFIVLLEVKAFFIDRGEGLSIQHWLLKALNS
jgi:hypothetical protein